MRAKRYLLLTGLVVVSAFGSGLGTSAALQNEGSGLPSLEAVKSIPYTTTRAEQKESVTYSTVAGFLSVCRAYAKGIGLVSQFQEPVLTRGSSGIALYRRASPSVVLVTTGNIQNGKVTDVGIGTGVVVDQAGYVLTNWHVINGSQVALIFFKPASGTDPFDQDGYGVQLLSADKTADLALLKIVRPPSSLRALNFGDMSAIQVAEDIHIIGHPHGLFWSYSTGVISQVRDGYEWKYSDGSQHTANVLQMQTAINPGNSGGPVLDDAGNILGLVAMSEDGQNIDYAIAVDAIKKFVTAARALATRGSSVESSAISPLGHFSGQC